MKRWCSVKTYVKAGVYKDQPMKVRTLVTSIKFTTDVIIVAIVRWGGTAMPPSPPSLCQRFKVEQRAPAGLMGRRVVERPWQVVAGNIIGPLPRTSKGFEYIVVFQDLFSRWAEASLIRKANAKAVVGEQDRKVFRSFPLWQRYRVQEPGRRGLPEGARCASHQPTTPRLIRWSGPIVP